MNRILILLTVAGSVAGCGVIGRQQGSVERWPTETHRVEQHDPVRQETPHVEYPLLDEKYPEGGFRPFPMQFDGLETQYVRAQGIVIPMPQDGLVVPMEKLGADFCYPLKGRFISDYGMRSGRQHTGIDIKAMKGDTIRAAFSGVVRMSKLYSSYGNIVVIRHYSGLETAYAHNSKNLVVPNDVVRAGDPIALAGRTGRATTEHLHFEVRAGGMPIDPKLVVDPDKMELRDGWLLVSMKNGAVSAANTPEGLDLAEDAAVADEAAHKEALDKAIAESESVSKTVAPVAEPVYYTIKSGDVLGKIAIKYGTTVSKLCSLNGLKSPDRIRAGQRIRVK